MQTAILTETSTQAVARTHGNYAHAESLNVQKRIGSTVYEVNVYFNPDAKETMNEKIMRLVRNEIQSGKVAV